MKRSHLFSLALMLALLLGALYIGHAQTVRHSGLSRPASTIAAQLGIRPPRPIPPPIWYPPIQQVLTVESVSVRATVTDGVAQTDVEQLWKNETERPQEGVYLFPVPEGATLSDFALYDGERKMTARLLDRDEARETYEGIVRRMRDPALLQYVGHSTYEVKLFPVPPHATRKITLRYAEVLRPEGGSTRKYLFSFVADALGGTRQASAPPKSTTVQVTLHDSAPLANIYSPTQQVSVRREGDKSAVVTWEAKNERVKGDFLLYYSTTPRGPVGLSLLAYNVSLPRARTAAFTPGDGKRDSGYFLLMASPKTELLDTQILPKRVILVLDRSGSMSGEKIEQAKGALSFVLKNLRGGDQFDVMTFNEANDILSPSGLLTATPDNIKRGLAFVKDIQAEGGTNIYDALDAALKLLPTSPGDGRQNMVIFLTDGLPTVGETDPPKIIERARSLGRARAVRLFDFGVGYDVDVHFLDRLAQQNRGDSDYVRPEEDIEAKVSRFYKKVASPVLTDVHIELDGVKTADTFPRPSDLPDLFAGSQLLIAGRYVGSGPVTARLVGTVNGKPMAYTLTSNLPAVADTNDFLPRLWATRKIGYLLDAIRLRQTEGGGDAHSATGDRELVDEVVRLSKEYGILTPYTSFLVTDESERPEPIPLGVGDNVYGLPGGRGSSAGGGFGGSPQSPGALYRSRSGASATSESLSLRASKAAAAPSVTVGLPEETAAGKDVARDRIRAAGAKTFFLKADVWTDSAYDPAKHKEVTAVRAYSDAHFALLKALPALAAYSALGDNVLVVLDNGQVVKITADGGLATLDRAALHRLTMP